ncbi:MAG TPA: IPT/TIG domain-containing protein [Bryobacteraceae bacterium]|nr:IPT/TIG domain-containing protein [Bryobacteraceae bacterium]
MNRRCTTVLRACRKLLYLTPLLGALNASLVQAQSILGSNLIVNSDAEAGAAGTDIAHPVASIPNWTKAGTGTVTVLPYTITNYLNSSKPAPATRGFQYFAGAGYPAPVTLSQDIDVSAAASLIGGGSVKYTISGYLGSSNPGDYYGSAQIAVAFKNSAGQTFTTATIGPISYPGNAILYQESMGLVPTGTVKVTVTMSFGGINGGNGAFDNLSLVLAQLDTSPGTVLGHNLVMNPGAEVGPNAAPSAVAPYIPGWASTSAETVAPYGGAGWVSTTDPGPADRGVNVFCGIRAAITSSMYQDIDVSAASSLIDAGKVTYDVSAWLGRTASSPGASLKYTFFDWSTTPRQLAPTAQLIVAQVPGSGLVNSSHGDVLPAGTRRVHIEVDLPANGALADNVGFILAAPSGPPVITPGGIVSAGAFGGFTAIAPGSWIEIYGANLASAVQNWAGSDFVNGVGPTALGGVTVSIGGAPAYIDYVSPGQVNALVPSNAQTGAVQITITNGNGVSDGYGIYVNPMEPGLLAPGNFVVGGKQYVAALLSDGTFALPVNAITGVPSRPAKPGETVTIYGVGFGPVSGGFTAGTIVTDQNVLMTSLQMQFGSANAVLSYQGLAPSFTGLYQFNVTAPSGATNAATALSYTLGGTKGSQSLYIATGN